MRHIQFASDVIRDGMGVELVEPGYNVLAELFRSDVTGNFHLNTFGNEIPVGDIRRMFDEAVRREGLSFSIPSEQATVIYVELLSEAVKCFRPVLAHRIGDSVYRIDPLFSIPDDEEWAFQPGDEVVCEDFNDGFNSPRAVKLNTINSEQTDAGNRAEPGA